LTEHLIGQLGQLGYLGIVLALVLGGLGLPIPEEVPIILAAVLARNEQLAWPFALASCLAGVLLGDMVVYLLGYFYGEKVISLPLTRRLITRQREAQIKGYFHRHGFKILVSGRFVPGFRTAAYLTAGILKLPTLKLILIDLVAASLTTFLMFGLGYAFAHQIQKGIREAQQWVTIGVAVGIAVWLLMRYYRARHRAGLPVGPPVLEEDDVPLPSDEFRAAVAGYAPLAERASSGGAVGAESTSAAGAESTGPDARGAPAGAGTAPRAGRAPVALAPEGRAAPPTLDDAVSVGVPTSPSARPLESRSR
jgi:membrane protein DedA with SNARE-associated domain